MSFFSWLSDFTPQKAELKIASVLALSAICITFTLTLWSFFSTPKSTMRTPAIHNTEVQTTEHPTYTNLQTEEWTRKAKERKQVIQKETKQPEQKIIKPQPTQKTKINIGQGNYFVQVGAFKQAKLARLMLEKMKKKYHYAIIKRKADKHAVWVGPVVTKKDALTLKKHLQRKSNLQGFIVTAK